MPQRDETILLMEACHVAQVAAIEKACFSEPWSEAAFRSELTNPQALTLVALREGQVAGFVNIAFAADTADINTVAVGAAYRRQGIGKRLLLAMEAWMEGQVSAYFLEVRQSNAPANSRSAAGRRSPCISPWDTGRWGCAPGIITSRMRMDCSCGKM